jgi:hypothetical protein
MCVNFYIVINIHILNTFQAFHFKLLQCLFLIRNIRQAQHKKCRFLMDHLGCQIEYDESFNSILCNKFYKRYFSHERLEKFINGLHTILFLRPNKQYKYTVNSKYVTILKHQDLQTNCENHVYSVLRYRSA